MARNRAIGTSQLKQGTELEVQLALAKYRTRSTRWRLQRTALEKPVSYRRKQNQRNQLASEGNVSRGTSQLKQGTEPKKPVSFRKDQNQRNPLQLQQKTELQWNPVSYIREHNHRNWLAIAENSHSSCKGKRPWKTEVDMLPLHTVDETIWPQNEVSCPVTRSEDLMTETTDPAA